MAAGRDTRVFLPARLAAQWVRYLRGVQDLTLEGSLEPRRWIGCAEGFWLGVASDTSDWLRGLGYGDHPPVVPGMPPVRGAALAAGNQLVEITIEVAEEAFTVLGCDEVELQPSPLQCRHSVVALPGRNLRFAPPTVTRTQRASELKVFDLPPLVSGMELRGVVWASPAGNAATAPAAPVVVASVVIRVT